MFTCQACGAPPSDVEFGKPMFVKTSVIVFVPIRAGEAQQYTRPVTPALPPDTDLFSLDSKPG